MATKDAATQAGNGSGTVARAMPSAVERLIRLMSGRAEMEAADGTVNYDNVNAILMAETEDDMWEADEQGQLGGRDLAGITQRILSYEVKYGNAEMEGNTIFIDAQGHRMYLLVTAVRLSERSGKNDRGPGPGEQFSWNTSAPRLVAKLVWLEQHDMFPADAVIEATDIGAGRAVLKLKPAPRLAQVG
jgi:hypothetical protein